jgi:NAD(P)-dependent dehydrogenase (short-subunit alcohol dehydrogenase family)
MVKLEAVRSANAALVQRQPLVAVFFGGTSGIGHYTLRALAAAEGKGGKGLRAYIVGRKAQIADSIIAECRILCPDGEFIFIKVDDLSLMKEVDRVCADIIQQEESKTKTPRIDYLMVSQGGPIFRPRNGKFHCSLMI